jgi:hypothetical protein
MWMKGLGTGRGMLLLAAALLCVTAMMPSALALGINLVTPVSPANLSWTAGTNSTVQFIFNYTGDNATASCMLFINSVEVDVNASVPNATSAVLYSNTTLPAVSMWYAICTNVSSVSSQVSTLRVDSTAPVVAISYPANTTYYTVTYFNFSLGEANTDSCWYNTGAANTTITCQNGTALSLTEGAKSLAVFANDSAGNIGGATVYFTLDKTAPAVTLLYPGSNANISSQSMGFNFTSNDTWSATTSCTLYINGLGSGANATVKNATATTLANTTIPEGANSWYVNCTDLSGNTTQSSVRTLNVDLTAPAVTITYPTNTSLYNVTYFNFTATDANLASWWYNNGTGGANYSASPTFTNATAIIYAQGARSLAVYVSDSAGNIGGATVYFTVDWTMPSITAVANTTGSGAWSYITWNTTEAANASVLIGTASDSLAVNGSNSSFLIEHNITVQYLAPGTLYYYNVTSCDAAGNCNPTGPKNFTTVSCSASLVCGAWSSCNAGTRTRSCSDANFCEYPFDSTQSETCSSGSHHGSSSSPATPPESVSMRPELVPGRGIIGNEKLLAAMEKVLAKGHLSESAKENLLRLSSSITQEVGIERTMEAVGQRTKMTTRMTYGGSKKAYNLMVYESIPKSFGASASDITVTAAGATVEVVEEDPTFLVTFAEVSPGDELSISYESSGWKTAQSASDVETEIYAGSLEEMVPAPAPEPTVCTASQRRCSGDMLQQCAADGSAWTDLEWCAGTCDSTSFTCKGQHDVGPAAGIANTLSPYYPYMLPIALVALAAALIAINYEKKKKAKKQPTPAAKVREAVETVVKARAKGRGRKKKGHK